MFKNSPKIVGITSNFFDSRIINGVSILFRNFDTFKYSMSLNSSYNYMFCTKYNLESFLIKQNNELVKVNLIVLDESLYEELKCNLDIIDSKLEMYEDFFKNTDKKVLIDNFKSKNEEIDLKWVLNYLEITRNNLNKLLTKVTKETKFFYFTNTHDLKEVNINNHFLTDIEFISFNSIGKKVKNHELGSIKLYLNDPNFRLFTCNEEQEHNIFDLVNLNLSFITN